MGHLLRHLKEHDLSVAFLEPVNVEENKGYQSAVRTENRVDLDTMLARYEDGRYSETTSRTSVLLCRDFDKMWQSCRDYAGYGKQGQDPPAGAELDAIVRCACVLESLTRKFAREHLLAEQVPESWAEAPWSPKLGDLDLWSLPANKEAAAVIEQEEAEAARQREEAAAALREEEGL